MSNLTTVRAKGSLRERLQMSWRSGNISSNLMLIPAIFFLLVCSVYPFLWIFRYVLCNYNGFTSTYTGMANITRMMGDTTFWKSVVSTFEYALYKLVFIIPMALLMAVLLNQKLRGGSVFRAVYFMPTVIATSISGMIFTFIFATKNGVLNGVLRQLGLQVGPRVNWLGDPAMVMVAVTILAVWGGFGNYMLYFINGINGISEDVYESAKIDGASGVRTFFSITLPMLSPVLKVILMLAITGAFKDYEAIMVLTQGGPGNRSMVMFLYIYNLIFGSAAGSQAQIGYGALLSVVAAVIVGIVTIIYNLVSRKLDNVM